MTDPRDLPGNDERRDEEPEPIPSKLLWDHRPAPKRSLLGLILPFLMIAAAAGIIALATTCGFAQIVR